MLDVAAEPPSRERHHPTLVLATLLHAFTHALGTMLVPLYLLIVADLRLEGVWQASLVVTIYGMVYCLGSYGSGVLADRFDRKWLLGVGLIGNALAIAAMGLTSRYEVLVALGVVAGLFGTLFHPCANSLVPAHYPRNPGMAIGVLGMGAGLGFFAGPQYAGWRAEAATWQIPGLELAAWQRPCIELGLLGVVTGVAFLLVAREARARRPRVSLAAAADEDGEAMLPDRVAIEAIVTDVRGRGIRPHQHLTAALRRRVIAIAAVLGWRDFAGVASLTLVSVYLQKAHGYTPKHAGLVVGGMMLVSVLANPVAVYLSPGRRRLPALAVVLVAAGLVLAAVPFVPVAWALPVLSVFQTFQLGSYAISDAAMLERVDASVRGRVVGLFLTLAGVIASTSPFVMGFWTDLLGDAAYRQSGYVAPFAALAGMMVVASLSAPLIAGINRTAPAAAPAAAEPVPA